MSFIRLNSVILDLLENLGLGHIFKFETPPLYQWINSVLRTYENSLKKETEEFTSGITKKSKEETGSIDEDSIFDYIEEYKTLFHKYLYLYFEMRLYLEYKHFSVPEKIPNEYTNIKNVFWGMGEDGEFKNKFSKLSDVHKKRITYLMNFSQNQLSSFPMAQAFIFTKTDNILEKMSKEGRLNFLKIGKEEKGVLPNLKEKEKKFRK
jgi:hypothetical protein